MGLAAAGVTVTEQDCPAVTSRLHVVERLSTLEVPLVNGPFQVLPRHLMRLTDGVGRGWQWGDVVLGPKMCAWPFPLSFLLPMAVNAVTSIPSHPQSRKTTSITCF